MKARRRNRLSAENRKLINELDLQEPEVRPLTLEEAIRVTAIDKRVDELQARAEREQIDPIDMLAGIVLRGDMERFANVPIQVDGPRPWSAPEPEEQEEKEVTPEPMPAPTQPQRRGHHTAGKLPLTDEQRAEIAEAFKAGEPTSEICRAYEIGQATLYNIVRKAGIPLRKAQATVPSKPSINGVTVGVVDTVPSLNGTSTTVLPTWTVIYTVRRTEQQIVAAASFNDAAAAVQKLGDDDIEVLSVSKVM